MKKDPFRLTPYQVQWLLIVGFLSVGYALYLFEERPDGDQTTPQCPAWFVQTTRRRRMTSLSFVA